MEGCETIRQGVTHPKWRQKMRFEQGGVTRLTLFIVHRGAGKWATLFARLPCSSG
ncbi:hypothetical protein EFW58_02374 [Bacillus velezensis]|nr:hypothetical protein EFW58_02374 [Bacillus velezensis]